jgi:multidrug efflux system outer membrane protein
MRKRRRQARRKKMSKHTYWLALMVMLLSACATPTDLQKTAGELPASWAAPMGQAASGVSAQWWTIYGDLTLNRLVDEALRQNANLALAVARVDEARAQLGITGADQWPSVDASFNRSRQQHSLKGATPLPPGIPRQTNDYRAQLNASYELDLWGKLRHASAAARADLLASEAAQDTVRITLAADVVQGYFALRALDEQIAATQRSIGTRNEWLGLQQKRLDAGVISEFDFRQLEADVAGAQAQLPTLELQRAQQEHALAVLLGRSPKAIYEDQVAHDTAADNTILPLVVPAGLPSDLLLRRPDLIEAEQRLLAADARIAEARAAVFPAISLTGSYGSESTALRDLFSGPTILWSLAAAITQPIFSAGKLKAGIALTEARQHQAVAQYQQATQNAFKDVRDALAAQTKMRERLQAETQRVGALRQALGLARLRYENGVASQLDVLDAERNLLTAEQSRAEALRAQRAAIADLFKALGGSWRTGAASPG